MRQRAVAEPEKSRILVQDIGQDGFGNIAANNLIAHRAGVILAESGESAVVAEASRCDLGLDCVPRQQNIVGPIEAVAARDGILLASAKRRIGWAENIGAVVRDHAEKPLRN